MTYADASDAVRQRLVKARQDGRLRLASPASEDVVSAFERHYSIELPEDYRWFVSHLGNGGVGPPYYGLEPLSDRLIEANSALSPDENHNDRLAEPFLAREGDWSELEPEDADALWTGYVPGRLLLGTDGCAILWVLVVSGPARGEVWRLGDDTATLAAKTFEAWYAGWLDRRGPEPDDPVPVALSMSDRRGMLRLIGRFRR